MVQEGDDLRLAHLQRMPLAVEQDESPDPVHVGLLGADAVMQAPGRGTDLVKESRHGRDSPRGIPSKSGWPIERCRKSRQNSELPGIIRKKRRNTIRLYRSRNLVSRRRLAVDAPVLWEPLLRDALAALAAPPDKQVRCNGPGCIACDLLNDFDHARLAWILMVPDP